MRNFGVVVSACVLVSACASPHALTPTRSPQYAQSASGAGVSDPKSHFRDLAKQGQHTAAMRFYVSNRQRLPLTDPEIVSLVDSTVLKINWEHETALRQASRSIRGWSDGDLENPAKWASIKESQLQADAASAAYNALPFVSDLRHRSRAFNQLQEERGALNRRLDERGWGAFVASYKQNVPFFAAYPGRASPAEFFVRNTNGLRKELSGASRKEVDALLASYGHLFPPTVSLFASLRTTRESNKAADNKRAFWEQSLWYGASPSDITLADLSVAQYFVHVGPPQLEIVGASAAGAELTLSQLQAVDSPYAAVVVQRSPSISRRVIQKVAQEGRYLQAEYQVPNPSFAAAQAKFISAQANLNNVRLRNTLNRQASFAGALIAGLAEGVSGSEVSAAQNELASTPATIAQQVYGTYQFEVLTVESSRTVPYEVFILDLSAGKAKRLFKTRSQQKTFMVPHGRRPDDLTSVSQSFVTETKISEWEGEPLPLSLEVAELMADLATAGDTDLASLQKISAGKPRDAQIAGLRSFRSDTTTYAREDPRFDSVVVLHSADGLGAGFFIEDFIVVTNYHVVDRSPVVQVTMRDGSRAVGQVIKSDIGADLALVRVTQKGRPVKISTDPIGPGETVDAIGHPKGYEFTLTRGIVSAVRKMPGNYASGDVTFIQMDTPINPGNSGGPLFRGDSVVGINTWKRGGGESLGFAVHASELSRVLASH